MIVVRFYYLICKSNVVFDWFVFVLSISCSSWCICPSSNYLFSSITMAWYYYFYFQFYQTLFYMFPVVHRLLLPYFLWYDFYLTFFYQSKFMKTFLTAKINFSGVFCISSVLFIDYPALVSSYSFITNFNCNKASYFYCWFITMLGTSSDLKVFEKICLESLNWSELCLLQMCREL